MTEHCSTPVLRDGQMITNKETEEISDVQRKLGECSVPEVLLSGPFFVLWLESRLLLGLFGYVCWPFCAAGFSAPHLGYVRQKNTQAVYSLT